MNEEISALRMRVDDIAETALTAKLTSDANCREIKLLRQAVLQIQIRVAAWSSIIGLGSAALTAYIIKYIG